MTVNLNDPRRADARGWGAMWSPTGARRTDMVELVVDGTEFIGGIHPKLHTLAETLLLECVARGYEIRKQPQQAWGFAWRPIRGTENYANPIPTNHSSGTAFDVNSAYNWLGRSDGGDIPTSMRILFAGYGWRWGGNYVSRPDPMHFEFMGTVADAVILTAQAEEEMMGLTAEEKAQLAQMEAFLNAVRDPLRPGKDVATAAGAGARVAKAVLGFEREAEDPDGVEH